MDMYGEEGNEKDRNLAQAIIDCIRAMKGKDGDTSDSVEEFREKTRDVLQNSPRLLGHVKPLDICMRFMTA